MKKRILITSTLVVASLIVAILVEGAGGFPQNRACLRVMPIDELARGASFIGRVKVVKVEKINYRGSYGQLATVTPVEVIDGDIRLKKISILSKSNIQCAEDDYIVGQEMLVFLVPADSLFRTLNFQYGQFLIAGNVVRGWRDKNNKPVDKLYVDAQKEIECILNPNQTPSQTPPAGENNPPRTPVAGDPPGSRSGSPQALPAQPGVVPTPTPSPSPKHKRPSSQG